MHILGGVVERTCRKIFEGPIGILSRFFRHDYNVVDIVYRNAAERSARIVEEEMHGALAIRSKESLLRFATEKVSTSGLWLEFGVFRGTSINFLSNYCKQIYGFDSFEGLSEDWKGNSHAKGSFNLNGKLPKVKNNVKLIHGYFQDTLVGFIKSIKDSKIALIHLDCDTYESTIFVLNALRDSIDKSSILIFDDYFGAPGFEMGQFKALEEYKKTNNLNCIFLAYSRQSVVLRFEY